MFLPEQKFLVKSVSGTERTKDGKHEYCTVVLIRPGYTDEFGEKRSDDDLFECKAWNKTLEQMPVIKHGDKVKAVLNLQGREYFDQQQTQFHYGLQLTIRKIEILS